MKKVEKLALNNLKNCQKTLARLIRQFHAEEKPDIARYRCEGYLIKILVESYQFDKQREIEDRILALEKYVSCET